MEAGVDRDADDHVRRQLRTLQWVVGSPTDSVLARRSGVAAATFSEVMSGKRRPRPEFVAKVVSGCLVCARAGGHAPLDERRVLQALRLPGHEASDSGILERDEDLSRCSAVLDAVRNRAGAVIVVEGSAGIGKSELVARVCAEAAVRGVTPLAVRGNQRDQTLAFGAVRTLLARWVASREPRDRQDLFNGAAAFARVPLGLPLGPPHGQGGGPDSVIGLTEALYWLVVNACDLLGTGRGEPGLLFAVDDAHWLDEESLSWLEFLSDRLAGLPLVLVVAYRPHEPGPTPALRRIALRAAQTVRLRPLSPDAVRTIIGRSLAAARTRRADDQPPDNAFCAAFAQHSGGNPFYLRWMLDLARERGLAPTAGSAEQVGTLTPRHVVAYLNELLTGLGPAARRLAQAVAVLGPGCALDRVAVLAELPLAEAKREYDRLCDASILAPDPQLDFCHPIIRGAIYEDIDRSRRSDGHLAAARQLHYEGADPDAVAAHLVQVRAAADPWVVDRLSSAAAGAMATGLSSMAARYLQRAVGEPPPPVDRCRVRLRYGQALALGQVAAALPELLAAYQQADDESLRTEAAVALAKTYGYADRLADSVRLLDGAIDRCTDDRLRDQLITEQLLWATWWGDDPARADRMHLLDRIAAPLAGTTYQQRMLIAMHAWSLVQRGRPHAAALTAIEPVIRRGVVFADLDEGMELATMTAFVHMYSGPVGVAHALFEQAIGEFDQQGWRGTHLAFAHANLANAALRQGRLADAIADADIALRLADRSGEGTPAEWFATGTLIEALVARGDPERAALISTNRRYAEQQPDAFVLPVPRAVLGALHLARRDTTRAIDSLRAAGRHLDQASIANPAVCPWRFDLALALRHSAPDEAHAVAAEAQRRADAFGDPTTRGRAMRSRAALDPDSPIELLQESADVLREAANRYEYAGTLAELGTALIRAGHPRDARQPLTDALALADECGALSLRTAVSQRLVQAGGAATPARRTSTLHPREQRAAHLAAQGRSDAEIAHAMVLGLDTVADLLRGARDKLAATSRAELRRILDDSRPDHGGST
jgi:DNA-binding CsgD family transcriptional regulator